jgi:hypothetical protein
VTEETTVQERPTAEVWSIPRRVWFVLMSWGLAVMVLAGLFSFWTYANQKRQDKDMCTMVAALMAAPDPPDGPSGERSRITRAALQAYANSRDCGPIRS